MPKFLKPAFWIAPPDFKPNQTQNRSYFSAWKSEQDGLQGVSVSAQVDRYRGRVKRIERSSKKPKMVFVEDETIRRGKYPDYFNALMELDRTFDGLYEWSKTHLDPERAEVWAKQWLRLKAKIHDPNEVFRVDIPQAFGSGKEDLEFLLELLQSEDPIPSEQEKVRIIENFHLSEDLNVCAAGCFTNINTVLGNLTDTPVHVFHRVKKQWLIKQFGNYISFHRLSRSNNEVHYGNAFFNFLSQRFGFQCIEDNQAPLSLDTGIEYIDVEADIELITAQVLRPTVIMQAVIQQKLDLLASQYSQGNAQVIIQSFQNFNIILEVADIWGCYNEDGTQIDEASLEALKIKLFQALLNYMIEQQLVDDFIEWIELPGYRLYFNKDRFSASWLMPTDDEEAEPISLRALLSDPSHPQLVFNDAVKVRLNESFANDMTRQIAYMIEDGVEEQAIIKFINFIPPALWSPTEKLIEFDQQDLLVIAASHNKMELAKAIVAFGGNVNAVDIYNESSLEFAFRQRSAFDTVVCLYDLGANIEGVANDNYKYGRSSFNALQFVVVLGHVELARRLLRFNPDLNQFPLGTRSALHLAAEAGQLGCLQLLIQAKPMYINQQYADGSPLHFALKNGHKQCAAELIRHGTDLLAEVAGGINKRRHWTYVHYAASIGDAEIMALLLSQLLEKLGSKQKLSDYMKFRFCYALETPLMIAVRKNHTKVCEQMAEVGADIESRTQDGIFPREGDTLVFASDLGHENAFCAILRAAMKNPELAKKIQDNPAQYCIAAIRLDSTEAIDLLLELNVDINTVFQAKHVTWSNSAGEVWDVAALTHMKAPFKVLNHLLEKQIRVFYHSYSTVLLQLIELRQVHLIAFIMSIQGSWAAELTKRQLLKKGAWHKCFERRSGESDLAATEFALLTYPNPNDLIEMLDKIYQQTQHLFTTDLAMAVDPIKAIYNLFLRADAELLNEDRQQFMQVVWMQLLRLFIETQNEDIDKKAIGRSLYITAVERMSAPMVKAIVELGFDPDDSMIPLWHICAGVATAYQLKYQAFNAFAAEISDIGDKNARNVFGETALHIFVRECKLKHRSRWLSSYSPLTQSFRTDESALATDAAGNTALHYAIRTGVASLCTAVIDSNYAVLLATNHRGLNPVHEIISRGLAFEVVLHLSQLLGHKVKEALFKPVAGVPLEHFLLDTRYSDPNKPGTIPDLILMNYHASALDAHGQTVTERVVRSGDMSMLDILKKNHLSRAIFGVNAKGETALHVAVEIGDFEMVSELVAIPGIPLNRMDGLYRTPLDVAIRMKHQAIEHVLRSRRAKTSQELNIEKRVPIKAPRQQSVFKPDSPPPRSASVPKDLCMLSGPQTRKTA